MSSRIVPISISSKPLDNTYTKTVANGFELYSDAPEHIGGTEKAPRPLVTMMSSLVSAHSILIQLLAKEYRVKVKDLKIDANFDYKSIKVSSQEQSRNPIDKVEMHIKLKTDVTAKRLKELREKLKDRNAIASILRKSGIDIAEFWDVGKI